ncbi:MAG TPA: DUF6503 family protein [Acidobacteriota bacterium]|nr:DUF6503 family protein [Acidobacteriota bacterium]
MRLNAVWLVGLLLSGCGGAAEEAQPREAEAPSQEVAASGFSAPIEAAHNAAAWRAKEVFQAGLEISFGGNPIFQGDMLMDVSGAPARLDRQDGASVVYAQGEAWVTPASAEFSQARFHVLTWPYFLAAPFKLNDPGTSIEETGKAMLGDKEYDTAKLTFEAGTGDTPDDWYLLYRDPDSGRLMAMSYIVTYGTSTKEASQDPHLIAYEDFQTVEGIPIPRKWVFWTWREGQGIVGDTPIGQVLLTNPQFLLAASARFQRPQDARKAELPSQ